ncbi:hypothetical protein ACIRP2_30700 [Streptomyces sp. NPDC101194]|uniref:hypothetical protein n=1 Tax=Streptomyces sp. NPDC101194 TaxID=3366127 RepID=UPI0038101239
MDAEVAGLVGALGGGVIGAAGASFAALVAFRGARYQSDRQAEATREQWLRQIRRDLYVEFIAACRICYKEMQSAVADSGAVDAAGVQRWTEAALTVTNAYRAMELEAPDPLVRLAERLQLMSAPPGAVLDAAVNGSSLVHADNLRAEQVLITFYELLRVFVVDCRNSLQGDQPPGSFAPVRV